MAIHKFTQLIDEGREIEMYGNGSSKRDYTYIEDIVDGIVNAAGIREGYEIINLGNSDVVELRYLIGVIEQNLGKKAKIKELPDQPGDVPITYADISKARSLISYDPQVKIEEGVRKFVEWYRTERTVFEESNISEISEIIESHIPAAVQSPDEDRSKERKYIIA